MTRREVHAAVFTYTHEDGWRPSCSCNTWRGEPSRAFTVADARHAAHAQAARVTS